MPKVTLILPDFILIGANKAGTTSVASYLAQHPQIRMSAAKEPMFFSTDATMVSPTKGGASLARPYFTADIFAYSDEFSGWKEDALAFGEASTAYLCNPRVAAPLIRKIVPEVKLLAVLRDPIERAMSAYRMCLGNKIEGRDFADVVAECRTGIALANRQGVKDYWRNGLYGRQIEVFRRYFSRERMLFVKFDDLAASAAGVLAVMCKFLGVEEFSFSSERRLNVASEHTDRDIRLSKEERRFLRSVFAEDVRLTEELTGLDLSSWLTE